MKTKAEIRAKNKLKKLKLEARRMGILHDAPPEPKKVTKQEFELFKIIANSRANNLGFVYAKHITKNGKEMIKPISLENLTHWNFDHTTPKSRGKDYKLDPDNIQIVSVAWHFWKTNGQLLQIEYPN